MSNPTDPISNLQFAIEHAAKMGTLGVPILAATVFVLFFFVVYTKIR